MNITDLHRTLRSRIESAIWSAENSAYHAMEKGLTGADISVFGSNANSAVREAIALVNLADDIAKQDPTHNEGVNIMPLRVALGIAYGRTQQVFRGNMDERRKAATRAAHACKDATYAFIAFETVVKRLELIRLNAGKGNCTKTTTPVRSVDGFRVYSAGAIAERNTKTATA